MQSALLVDTEAGNVSRGRTGVRRVQHIEQPVFMVRLTGPAPPEGKTPARESPPSSTLTTEIWSLPASTAKSRLPSRVRISDPYVPSANAARLPWPPMLVTPASVRVPLAARVNDVIEFAPNR